MCAATDPRAREEYYGANPKPQKKSTLKAMRDDAAMRLSMREDAQKERQKLVASELMDIGNAALSKEAAKKDADIARVKEALTNPAAGVLTNPDLLRMIGSFIPNKQQQQEQSDKKWVKLREEYLDKQMKKLKKGLKRVNYFRSKREYDNAYKWLSYFTFRAKKRLNWSIQAPLNDDDDEDNEYMYISSDDAAKAVEELILGKPESMWNDKYITEEIQTQIQYMDLPTKDDNWYDMDIYN